MNKNRSVKLIFLLIFISSLLRASAQKPCIIIDNFRASGIARSTADLVKGFMDTEIINSGLFTVLERERLDSVIKEQQFCLTGLTIQEAVMVGKLLNAEQILLGVVSDISGVIWINLRMVNISNGQVIWSGQASSPAYGKIGKACKKLAGDLAQKKKSGFVAYQKKRGRFIPPSLEIPEMISIPATDDFMMGTPAGEPGRPAESPPHPVKLRNFLISKFEITVEQYACFLNNDGGSLYHPEMADPKFCGIVRSKGGFRVLENCEKKPIVCVSWNDAAAFCKWLTEITKENYRLPTEAEWEYAAVGNKEHRKYPWSDMNEWPEDYCNWCDGQKCSGQDDDFAGPAPVDSFEKGVSLFGLYNMAGNAEEWVSDWYSDYPRDGVVVENPQGGVSGTFKCIRGGSWANKPDFLRCSSRGSEKPGMYNNRIGFRVAQ